MFNKTFSSDKEVLNQKIFENWSDKNSIKIFNINKFSYSDSDFVDYLHLNKNRRDEFTQMLFDEFNNYKQYLIGQEYSTLVRRLLYCYKL